MGNVPSVTGFHIDLVQLIPAISYIPQSKKGPSMVVLGGIAGLQREPVWRAPCTFPVSSSVSSRAFLRLNTLLSCCMVIFLSVR